MEERNGVTAAESDENQAPPTSGDQMAVGDVHEGAAVAVGRGARAVTRIFNVDIRLLPVVVILLVAVGFLSYLLLRPKTSQEMTGEFNVAIAEFTVVDQNGSPAGGEDGRALADFLFRRLESHFAELDLQSVRYELWPPARTGQIKGETREERALAAEALAGRIGAHIVIYGVVTRADGRSQFAPEFYVNYKGFEESEEVAGRHEMGSALRVVLPFDATQFQDVENPALSARVNALSLITIGLSYYSIDDFEAALDYFERAEATKGWLQSAGKEVIYLLLGNASVRLTSKEKTPEYLPSALGYYDAALSINPAYARAKVGQAGVLYVQALGDPANPSLNDVDLGKLDEAAAAYEAALALEDAPESANIEAKVHFGLGQIDFVRAAVTGDDVTGDDWMARAEAEFEQVVQAYEGGDERIASLAGHSHAWLGLIARQRDDVETAVEHYTRAVELVTPFYQAYYYTRLGEVYVSDGQTSLAIEAYGEAIRIAEFYGDEESAIKYGERLNAIESGP